MYLSLLKNTEPYNPNLYHKLNKKYNKLKQELKKKDQYIVEIRQQQQTEMIGT